MQLSDTATSLVGFAASVLAVLLVAGLALALRRVNRLSDEVRRLSLARPVGAGDLAALRSDLEQALRHVAVVRYDAFGDMGGRLSFSAAVVDDRGRDAACRGGREPAGVGPVADHRRDREAGLDQRLQVAAPPGDEDREQAQNTLAAR